jgi:group I intron endonuclease
MAYSQKISGIYIITNLTTGKHYVGRSVNCYERFSKHKSVLRKGVHDNKHIQSAWNLYGGDDFIFEVLEESEPIFLPSLENYWCNLLNSHNRNYGYNTEPTSPYGKIASSKETIEKIRKSNTGKKVSDETKEKLRQINKGKKCSQSAIEKLKNHSRNMAVDAYTENGDFIKTFKSIREASRSLNIGVRNIRKCISGQVQITLKHIFKYNGDILSKEEIEYRNTNQFKNKKVSITGFYLDGSKIGDFDSFYQASKITNLDPTKISLCCRGVQKRVKNTYWQFNNLSTPIANPTPLS